MKKFNKLISGTRVRVEQAFGILKGRFPALKQMGTPADMRDAYRTVQALAVIHNFCINEGDRPDCIPEFDPDDAEIRTVMEELRGEVRGTVDGDDADVDVPAYETNAWLRVAGQEMRERIFNELFPE